MHHRLDGCLFFGHEHLNFCCGSLDALLLMFLHFTPLMQVYSRCNGVFLLGVERSHSPGRQRGLAMKLDSAAFRRTNRNRWLSAAYRPAVDGDGAPCERRDLALDEFIKLPGSCVRASSCGHSKAMGNAGVSSRTSCTAIIRTMNLDDVSVRCIRCPA